VKLPSLFDSGIAGVREQSLRMDKAAAQVTAIGAAQSSGTEGDATTVELSGKTPARPEEGDGAGLESALIDESIAKYMFIANLKTLQTGEDVARETTNLVRPKAK
jgi:hypothetical protein